jgi:hypothetical protein
MTSVDRGCVGGLGGRVRTGAGRQGADELFMNRGGMGAHLLVQAGVCGEVRRGERRHLVSSSGNHPGRRGCRRRIPRGPAEPMLCSSPAADASIAGSAVTNDMCSS